MHQSAFNHITAAFERYYDPTKHEQALDLGCRAVNGHTLTHRKIVEGTSLRYLGVDVVAGPNVDIVMEQPYTLPIEDDSADIIFCGQVFEHVPFFWATFLEMARVLRRGGYILLSAPSRGHRHSPPTDCWRFYPDAIRALGAFSCLEVVSAHTDFPPLIEGGTRLDYSKISSYRYWGDTVGVFSKTDTYPARAIAPVRKALVEWSNAKQLIKEPQPVGAPTMQDSPLVTFIAYAGGPIEVAYCEGIVSDVIRKKIESGKYERNEVAAIPQLLEDAEVVLELGSGLGVISTLAVKTGKVKEIHCFEADPRLIDLIRRTHEINGIANSHVHNIILTTNKEMIARNSTTFHLREHFYGSSLTSSVGKPVLASVEIPVKSFADAIESIRPTVIFCDIEGGEQDLFGGVDLSGVKRIMLETHQSVLGGKGMQRLFLDLIEAGFHYDERYSHKSVVVFSSIAKA